MTESPPGDTAAISPAVEDRLTDGHRKRRSIFVVIATALFMSSIDISIVATALPAIDRGLHATISWAGWTITIYSLTMVIVLPIAGRIGDHFGRRRVFFCGTALFTASSLLCGFSTDIYLLIVFRAVQAIGGGALLPSATGIISDHFGVNRDRAIGLFGTMAAAGQLVGPVLGGLLVGYLSWRWIFYVNVPIGVVLMYFTLRIIPESRAMASSKIDFRGLSLMAIAILAAIFGITNLGNGHIALDDPSFLVPEAVALTLLYFFVRHTRRSAAPFIPMRLFTAKGFAVMNGVNFLWGMVGFGVASLVPLYGEQRYHLPALNAGTLLAARAVGMIAVGAIAALALRRTGYRLPMTVGFSTVALGILVMSVPPRWGIAPAVWLGFGAAITGLGNGMANPAARNAILQLAPDDVAVITGLRTMFTYMGIIFSVSIVTAILSRSTNPGLTQAHIYWVVAGICLLVLVPLVSRVPDHKGTW